MACAASASGDRNAEVAALIDEGLRLSRSGRAEPAIGFYERAAALCEPAGDPDLARQQARALVNKAISLERLGRNAEAVDICDEILSRYSGDSHVAPSRHLLRTLLVKGYNLAELKRYEEAVATYDELLQRFGGIEDAKTLNLVALAFEFKSHALSQLDRPWDAFCAEERFIDLGNRLDEAEFTLRIAAALYNQGVLIGRLSPAELSQVAGMERLRDGMPSVTDPATEKPTVLERLFRTARTVASTGFLDSRSSLQIRAFDEVIAVSKNSHDHALRLWSAMAQVQKGSIMCELGRQRRAIRDIRRRAPPLRGMERSEVRRTGVQCPRRKEQGLGCPRET